MRGEGQFKAVQIGGPSGGCLTEKDLDLPLDFDSLKKVGAMIGSGGLVVMNDKTCMVEVARFFMHFTQNESCGKCTPCREGTKRMLEILERIVHGKGEEGDIELLLETEEDVVTLEESRYMISRPLCLCAESADLLEQGLRVFPGLALYDGTWEQEDAVISYFETKYGMIRL